MHDRKEEKGSGLGGAASDYRTVRKRAVGLFKEVIPEELSLSCDLCLQHERPLLSV